MRQRIGRRLLSIMLSVLMLISLLPTTVLAEELQDQTTAGVTEQVGEEENTGTVENSSENEGSTGTTVKTVTSGDELIAAIDAANNGDMIYLGDNVEVDALTLDKGITIKSEGTTQYEIKGLAAIKGEGVTLENVYLNLTQTLEIGGTNTTLTNCTIRAKDLGYWDVVDGNTTGLTGGKAWDNDACYLTKVTGTNVTMTNCMVDGTDKDDDSFPNMRLAPVSGTDVTMTNCTFNEGFGACYYSTPHGTWTLDGCKFTNIYCYNIQAGDTAANIVVKNCELAGWTSFGSSMTSVSFEDCSFAKSSGYATVVAYKDATFTNCTFTEDYKGNLYVEDSTVVELNGCKVVDAEGNVSATVGLADVADTQNMETNLVAIDATKDADGKYTGGTFVGSEKAVNEKLAETPTKNEDGTYSINYVAYVNGKGYTTLEKAFAAAEPVDGVITYEIYGKAEVSGDQWISFVKDATNVKKVVFIGNGTDAEISITSSKSILGVQGMDIDVELKDLTLSHPNGAWVDDLGNATKYFACMVRNEGHTVTYTNCTFPNGACNNQYGKTVFNSCKFTSTTDWNLWNTSTGDSELNGCTFTGKRGVKLYAEGSITEAGSVKVKDTTFELNDAGKAAIEITKPGSVELDNISVSGTTAGTIKKNLTDGYSNVEKVTVTATGTGISGSFTGTTESDKAKEEFNITAGTFTSEVSKDYLANGFELVKNAEDGTYGVDTIKVAQIGETKYESLAKAVSAANAGDTITLLADVSNTDYTVANVINVALKSGVTFDGNQKTLSGNIKITAASEGGVTIKNVNFKNIHNAAVVSDGYKAKYGFSDDKVGTLSAIYAPNLTGSLIITGCYFENIDWEAMQITPAEVANITIKDNIFTTSDSATVKEQLRHVHVEMAYGGGVDHEGENIKLTITDNQFLTDTKEANMGIWWVGKDSGLDLTGNYYKDPSAVSITLSDKGFNRENRCELIFPARSKANVDVDDLGYAAMVVKDAFNSKFYSSLAEAIAAAKDGETVKLLADVTADVTIGKNITLDLGGKTLTNTNTGKATISVADGVTATVKNGSVVGGTSYYNIGVGKAVNSTAKLTLVDVTATAGNTGSSMIDNWGTLIINSGDYSGGLNVVKSEEGSTLTINGGTFTLGYSVKWKYNAVILVYGDTTITGGEFINNAKTASSYPQVVMTGIVEGYEAITRVTGGTFTNNKAGNDNIFRGLGKATSANFEVSGGTFNKSVSDSYLADGYVVKKNADGTYGADGPYEAKIGSTGYETLQEAINAAKSSSTVTLLQDVDISSTGLTVSNTVTLDLKGYTVTAANTEAGNIKVYGKLTLTDSTDKNKDGTGAGKICTATTGYVPGSQDKVLVVVMSGGAFVMKSGLIDAATGIDDNANKGHFAVGLQNTTADASVTIDGGHIKAGWYAVAGNGQNATFNGDITVNGGILESVADYAIYHPQQGTTTINGGTIYGAAGGIHLNRGKLVVNDGIITSKGTGTTGTWGDGTGNSAAAAINVNASYGNADAEIKGGKITAEKDALLLTAAKNTGTIAVSGGQFSSEVPDEYCAPGYSSSDEKDAEGYYVVKSTPVEVWTGYSGVASNSKVASYATLKEAADNLATYQWILVAYNYTLEDDFTIPANVRLDIKSGATLTVPAEKTLTVAANAGRLGVLTDATLLNNGTIMVCGTSSAGGCVVDMGGTFSGKELSVPAGKVLDKQYGSYFAAEPTFRITYSDGTTKDVSVMGLASKLDGATELKLLRDVTGYTFSFDASDNLANGFVFDLGGNTLKTATGNANSAALTVGVSMTIQNGTIVFANGVAAGYGAIAVIDGGNLTIGDKVEVNGGLGYGVSVSGTGKLTVNAGTFTGANAVVINDGVDTNGINIMGGTFSTKIEEAWCADGYIPVKNADDSYIVKAGYFAAEVNGTKYEKLAEAVDAANNGDTVKLIHDVDLDEQIATGKAITIDGQGQYTIKATKKLVGTSGKAGMFYRTTSASGTLTFLNVTLDGNGVSKIFLNEGGAGETVFDGVTSINGGGIAYGAGIHISGGGSHATIRNSTLTGSQGTMALNDKQYYAANDLWVGGNVYVTVENSTIGTVFINSAPTANATSVVHGQLTITGKNTKIDYLAGDEEAADKVDKFGNNGSQMKIEGGFFKTIYDKGYYFITGGTFEEEPKSKWCAPNYEPVANGDGTYTVQHFNVARIDAVEYETLQKAIKAADTGATIVLLRDITVTSTVTFEKPGMNITIDLQSHKITGDKCRALHVIDGTLQINNTTPNNGEAVITSTGIDIASSVIRVGYGNHKLPKGEGTKNPVLEIKAGVTVKTDCSYGITVFGYGTEVLRVFGKVESTAATNASYDGCAISTVGEDVTRASVTIGGGTITATNTNAIYMPSGDLLVFDGAIVKGLTGIYAKSGRVTIKGAGIYGTGEAKTYEYNGNGGVPTGDALVIDNCGYPNGTPTVNYEGAKDAYFESANAKPIGSYATEGNTKVTGFVDKGTFNKPIGSDLLAVGYVCKYIEAGKYGVDTVENCVAKVDNVYYATLQDAIDAAKDDDTVTLVKDVDLTKTVVVNKTITLNMNGKKLYNTKDIWNDAESVKDWSLISVRGGNLTITGNGTLDAKENDCYAVDVKDDGKLTIENGKFVGNISAVYNRGGEVTIKGGDFSIKQLNSNNVQDAYGLLINCYDASYKAGEATITITGGTFQNFDPMNNAAEGAGTSFVAAGVGVDYNADGSYTAVENMTAQLVDADGKSVQAFGKLSDALTTAEAGQTVKLLAGVPDGQFVLVTANVTLDLNGYSIEKATLLYVTGQIIDTAATKGIVRADGYYINRNNEYTPVYDSEDNGYSFFDLDMDSKWVPAESKAYFALKKSGDYEAAAELMKANDSNRRVKAVITFSWDDKTSVGHQSYEFIDEHMSGYLSNVNAYALFAVVRGLDELGDGATITAQAKFVIYDAAGHEMYTLAGNSFTLEN